MATKSDLKTFGVGQAFGSTHIPKDANFAGKTIIVTGSNTGLGFEAAKHISRIGAERLIIACRDVQKGDAARDAIVSDKLCRTKSVEVWQLDLSSYSSVLAFGERVRTTLPRLDAFISNAGVEKMEFEWAEGLEMTLTVNVISTILLNIAVLPKLRETSTRYNTHTTLTSVGSSVHIFGKPEDLDAPPKGKDTFEMLSDPDTADMGGREAAMGPRYALTKTILHAILPHVAKQASRPGKQEEVIVNWLNPGWCASGLSRDKVGQPFMQRVSFALIGRTTEQGSRTLVHAITAGKESHGKYLSECRVTPESDFLRSGKGLAVSERLWRETMARIRKISPEVAGFVE